MEERQASLDGVHGPSRDLSVVLGRADQTVDLGVRRDARQGVPRDLWTELRDDRAGCLAERG